MMKKTLILPFIFWAVSALNAQTVSYDDVAVIVNDNSSASVEIGNYFQQKRNIPEVNMIHINCSTEERIDSTEARSLMHQVSNYLTSSNIAQSINYLVTTKGVPYILEGANCDSVPGFNKCYSIDQELTMVVNHEDLIVVPYTSFYNPYYDTLVPDFSQIENTYYLVTRLDGYTVDQVKSLIDRSGPNQKVDKNTAQFIFDLAFAGDTTATSPLVFVLNQGNEFVQSAGWNSIYNPESGTFITDEDNVLGYYSYIYQPSNKVLNYEWLKGSLAVQGMSSTAFTFTESENIYNDLIVADLIAEGTTGAAGYYGPYFVHSGTIWPEILYNRYTYGMDTISANNPYFNLAESYFQSIKTLPSVQVIVGDPKTSIVLSDPIGIHHHEDLTELRVFPNPASIQLTIEYTIKEKNPVYIKLYNHFGDMVYQTNEFSTVGKQQHLIDVSSLPKGLYVIDLEANSMRTREKVMIN